MRNTQARTLTDSQVRSMAHTAISAVRDDLRSGRNEAALRSAQEAQTMLVDCIRRNPETGYPVDAARQLLEGYENLAVDRIFAETVAEACNRAESNILARSDAESDWNDDEMI